MAGLGACATKATGRHGSHLRDETTGEDGVVAGGGRGRCLDHDAEDEDGGCDDDAVFSGDGLGHEACNRRSSASTKTGWKMKTHHSREYQAKLRVRE